jgi:hypothetical protein
MKTNWLTKFIKQLGRRRSHEADPETVRQLVRGIVSTRPDEVGCGECFEQVDRFAEMVLDGKDAAEALPLVEAHLNRCGDCHEEFEALLVALRAMV